MGKKLEIDPYVTSSVLFPFKSGTVNFLQQAYQERITAAIQSIIGIGYDATKVYIMFGCTATVVGGNTNFSAGALFFNGDVYIFDAQTVVTPSGPNIFVVNNTKTQYTTFADPVTFIGGSPENVHNIYKATIGTGLTGTGTLSGDANSDFSNLISSLNPFSSTGIVWSAVSAGTWADTGSPFFATAYKVSKNVVSLCGVATSSAVLGGGSPILTLPAIARPTKTVSLICLSSAGGVTVGNLTINSAGLVLLANTASSANGTVSFDGLSFRIF